MKYLAVIFALVLIAPVIAGCGGKTVVTTSAPSATVSTSPIPTEMQISTQPKTSITKNLPTTLPPSPTPTAAKNPARVSGIVYNRDANTTLTVNAAPADKALGSATVSSGAEKIVTDASGKYQLNNVIPGNQTITVTADGYIPSRVSWTFKAGESYTFNIGLYKAPQAVTPRPGFINGIITWDAGGWLNDVYYKPGKFQSTYSYAAANSGGNLVTVSDPLFITSASNEHVKMSTDSLSGSYWRMMNETEYTALVKDARGKGLQFMLWLGVMDEGKTNYYDIVYRNEKRPDSFWDDWFAEYEKYAVPIAQMAEKLGMEYINLGHDMGYAIDGYRFNGGAEDSLARWQKLTAAIRAVYHGKLTYFGGMSFKDDYYEDNGYPQGFVELFDAIGVNVQAISPAFNPTLTELKTAVTKLLDRYKEWKRPVFIMVRTPSVDGGTSFETYIEPLLVVNREADKHAMNLFQQADIYEAFYEVVNARPAGNGQVMGIFTWGYNYLDEYLIVPSKPASENAMAMDKSGNIRGKPAEAVMQYWNFGK